MTQDQWIEIGDNRFRIKPWTYGQRQGILRRIMKRKSNPLGGESMDVDPLDLQDEMLAVCVVGWNKETNVTLEKLNELPANVIDRLIAEVQRINGLTEDQRKKS